MGTTNMGPYGDSLFMSLYFGLSKLSACPHCLPTQHFSEAYEGVLVRFQMRAGTEKALRDVAVSAANLGTKRQFPSLKLGGKWMDDGTLLKIERGQLNIGLGRGKGLDVFNENIVGHETLKVIRK